MKLLISIDDTDNLESKGTGELAESMAMIIVKNAWGERTRITRHQLLVHPDIPYTSHNSSMCFTDEILDEYYDPLLASLQNFLEMNAAAGSDPGLCVVPVEELKDADRLIEFGQTAKRIILNKAAAYNLARELGIHLSEHGGTGEGIIGALAGAGLRLSGNDGRFRGKMKVGEPGECLSAEEIISLTGVDGLTDAQGNTPEAGDTVLIGDFVKAVLLDGHCLLLVEDNTDSEQPCRWRTAGKQRLKRY